MQKDNFCSPWKCQLCYLKRAFYLRFQPFGFLFLSRTWCSLSGPGTAAVLSLEHNLHKLVLSFRWGQVVRETMGGRKTPGSEDLSPFTRTSPGEQTGSDVIAADKCGGGGGVRRACTSVIPSSPRMTAPHCLRSFTPPLQRLLSAPDWKRMRSILFCSYCVFVR